MKCLFQSFQKAYGHMDMYTQCGKGVHRKVFINQFQIGLPTLKTLWQYRIVFVALSLLSGQFFVTESCGARSKPPGGQRFFFVSAQSLTWVGIQYMFFKIMILSDEGISLFSWTERRSGMPTLRSSQQSSECLQLHPSDHYRAADFYQQPPCV